MGFSPKLIVADVCLVISIIMGLFIQKNPNMLSNVKVALIVVALILLVISIVINLRQTFQKLNKYKKK